MKNRFNIAVWMFTLLLAVGYYAHAEDNPTKSLTAHPDNPESAKENQSVTDKHNQKNHWSQWETVKIAAAQVEIHTDSQIDRIVEFIDRAGADKAQMIVLGEYLLGPFYQDTSPAVKRVADAAQRNHIYVVVGGWEEFQPGAYAAKKKNAYANTALIFDRQGKIIGKYQKTHKAIGGAPHCWPPKGDEHEWLMKHGDGYPTFQLDFARVGIMTCYDGYFPESASCLSLNGAEIILWLNGRAGPVEEFVVQTDVFRNYCAMVSTNLGPGSGTMITTWPANTLAHITENGNHYISADLDLKNLRWYRANSRVHHQRRPELYNSITKPHQPWKVYENIEGMIFEGYPDQKKTDKETSCQK